MSPFGHIIAKIISGIAIIKKWEANALPNCSMLVKPLALRIIWPTITLEFQACPRHLRRNTPRIVLQAEMQRTPDTSGFQRFPVHTNGKYRCRPDAFALFVEQAQMHHSIDARNPADIFGRYQQTNIAMTSISVQLGADDRDMRTLRADGSSLGLDLDRHSRESIRGGHGDRDKHQQRYDYD